VSGGGFARSTCAGSLAIVAAAYLAGLIALPAVRRLAQLASGDATARVGDRSRCCWRGWRHPSGSTARPSGSTLRPWRCLAGASWLVCATASSRPAGVRWRRRCWLLFRGHGNGWWSLASGVVVLMGHLLAQRPMSWLMLSNGLFAASPICILALLPPSGELHSRLPGSPQQMRKALLGIAVAYAGIYALFVPAVNTTGIHWGSRFLLPVYPVLAVLASVSLVAWWERWKVRSALPRLLVAALVTLSFGLQLYSLALLSARKQFSQRLNAEVARDAAEIVITDTWFLPADLAHSFYEKPIFLARRSIDRRRLEAAAGSAGVERALLVERLRRGQAAPGGRLLSDGWLNFSSVVLRERALTADGPG
jgi:hypothetical protein